MHFITSCDLNFFAPFDSSQQCWASFSLPAGSTISLSCSYYSEPNYDYWAMGGGNLPGQSSLSGMMGLIGSGISGSSSLSATYTGGVQFLWRTDGSVTTPYTGFSCSATVTVNDVNEVFLSFFLIVNFIFL